ncbi:MAG: molecular chaperone HtpG [Gammaproteobacteria bacterium]|nr:molecular chaperone HtpG [Gammaproteobacteria bacterium]MDE2347774.1 molecular chaperone HtpG [Gammaproteobacteria bacterium]
MTVETTPERKEFQAETKQVLRLVIHALYSHKEIFLRELISNASDACEKLRFEALANPALMGGDEPSIRLIPDAATGTLTIKDNGIGMSRDEAIDNLGTIARSGTKRFLEALSGDAAKDAQLIGQFGVGFYSAFIVADKVIVRSKRPDADAVRWESDGEGAYDVAGCDKSDRGTEVILHLRADEKEFLEDSRLRQLVRKYSDHLGLPIVLEASGKEETINRAQAFWTRPKAGLTDEDYQAFFKHIVHDGGEARAWAHNKVEGAIEYTSLLYLPKRASFDLYDREQRAGIQLYVKRVFIMDKAAELLPPWLRFMRGLVDTADLPLNVSRELLQNNRTVEQIKSALVKRSLDLLEDLAASDPASYLEFWNSFGTVLKEGIIEEVGQRARVAKLMRLRSTASADGWVTFADYVARMKPDQKAIYYLTADSAAAARNSPHLEGFTAKGYEVLLFSDRIDEWVVNHLHEVEGKPLASAASAADDVAAAIQTPDHAAAESAFKDSLTRLTQALDGKIASARVSSRLTDSPACLVAGEFGISLRMARILKQAGQPNPLGTLPILEVNPKHPLVERLKEIADPGAFGDLAQVLFDQALLAEGGELEDPALFVRRVNKLIIDGLADKPKIILS